MKKLLTILLLIISAASMAQKNYAPPTDKHTITPVIVNHDTVKSVTIYYLVSDSIRVDVVFNGSRFYERKLVYSISSFLPINSNSPLKKRVFKKVSKDLNIKFID